MKNQKLFNNIKISWTKIIILLSLISGISGIFLYVNATNVNIDAGHYAIIKNTWTGELRVITTNPINRPFLKEALFEEAVHIRIAVDNVYMWSKYDDQFKETTHGDWEAPIGITSDGIKIAIDVNVFWTLSNDKSLITNLYLKYPNLDYKDRVIVPAVREVVRDVIASKTFDEVVISQRQELPNLIANGVLDKILSNPTLKGVIQIDKTSLQVLEIQMPKSVQDQLQAKKNSEIGIITASNLRQITIINADAQRQQQILTAQGLAQAKQIEANATQKAILSVIQSLGCGNNQTCEEKASQLYLQLLMFKEISQTGSNVYFIVGQSNGQFLMLPIQPIQQDTTKK